MIQDIVNALSTGGLAAVVALGLALVYGVMNLANWAYGDLMMIAGVTMIVMNGEPWWLMALAALASSVVASVLMERIAFRPVRSADETTGLIASFGVSMFIENAGVLAIGRRPVGVNFLAGLQNPVKVAGASTSALSLVTLAVVAGALIVFVAFLRNTSSGLRMRAAAEDFRAARLMGVNADAVIAGAFALSGLLAGIAGLIFISTTGVVDPTMGLNPVLLAFVAVVIGGMGSLAGGALAGFALGAGSDLLQTFLPVSMQGYVNAFIFGGVIVFVLVRPRGLFGHAALAERV